MKNELSTTLSLALQQDSFVHVFENLPRGATRARTP